MPRRRASRRQQAEFERFIAYIVVIFLGIWALYYLFSNYGIYIGITCALVLAGIISWQIWKFVKRRKLEGELGGILKKALKAMDDTAKTYADEEEANKELVSILKMQGHDATYQFRLGDGRKADARVGNVLIEGKLAPTVDEVDRLIGQVGAYSKHPYKINIVIYGHLTKMSLKRITEEILDRYPKKVFLSYLENSRRQRAS